MTRSRVSPILAAAGALLVTALVAQEPATTDLGELVRRLRIADSASARHAAVDALLAVGDAGALRAYDALRRERLDATRAFDRDARQVLKLIGRSAPRTLRERQGRDGPTRIAALRDEIDAVERADVTKESIEHEIDPRVAALEGLLVVTLEQVLAADDELVAEHAAFEQALAVLLELDVELDRVAYEVEVVPNGERHLRDYPVPTPIDGEQIRAGFRRAVAAATPMSDRDRQVLDDNAVLAVVHPETFLPGEIDGVAELNRLRILTGRAALAIDPKLCDAARGHSGDMERLGFFSHTSPVPGKESFGQRAALAGTSASAENIAAGQRTGSGAIRAWWYSPGHHRNMMGGAARVGLGRSGDHWTQMFGG